ncbi:Bax inhibitor-1/YccA family protein [Citricoccus sp. SGAir0253]|uniref:Bax inhibitor-1/YccA family protein n=1 Tax=Citricoccus sp. SGAir0253 TaxID=2567881 RepID=UPI0010CD29DB|nr:Bax inhibitor-1/YccA family protein [Citricoccus sp. SGAir0253]QCU78666.1 Bax inhibitor-1/YccA family protein [Citricoccus sp. SGAir0253]
MANPVFNTKNFQEQMHSGQGRQAPGWYQGGQSGQQGQGWYAGQQAPQYGQRAPQYSPEELQRLEQSYSGPAAGPADTGRMSYNDVIAKTVMTLVVVLAGAVVGWMMPALMLPGAIVGLVLGLVNSFKREPSPVLILLYAAAEGLFLGGISQVFEQMWPGIASQAVLATFCVFAVTLALYSSGKWRVTAKSVKIFMIAMIGYAVFSLVNLFLMLFGVTDAMFGLRGEYPLLGIGIGLLAVFLAAFSLVMDFTSITQGVQSGAPQKYSWTAAFGLTVTLVWLYVEILRILAILRGND